jgi:hypothetical protein
MSYFRASRRLFAKAAPRKLAPRSDLLGLKQAAGRLNEKLANNSAKYPQAPQGASKSDEFVSLRPPSN